MNVVQFLIIFALGLSSGLFIAFMMVVLTAPKSQPKVSVPPQVPAAKKKPSLKLVK